MKWNTEVRFILTTEATSYRGLGGCLCQQVDEDEYIPAANALGRNLTNFTLIQLTLSAAIEFIRAKSSYLWPQITDIYQATWKNLKDYYLIIGAIKTASPTKIITNLYA